MIEAPRHEDYDLHGIALDCAAIATANGFTRPNRRNVVNKIAFVFTEIDEAVDSVLEEGDPIEEELADIAIRLLHILHSMTSTVAGSPANWNDRIKGGHMRKMTPYAPIEVLLSPIFSECAKAVECWRKKEWTHLIQHLEIALKRTFEVAFALDIDLYAQIIAKCLKNADRGHLHGKANPEG
jgi:NTP pyrophosphatase (non-canonical NTP hydrolase)